MMAILGPTRAGKSTTLHALAGCVKHNITTKDNDFIDRTGKDAEAVQDLYVEQNFDNKSPEDKDEGRKKKKKRRMRMNNEPGEWRSEPPTMKRQLGNRVEQWSWPTLQKAGKMCDLERVHGTCGEGGLSALSRNQLMAEQAAEAHEKNKKCHHCVW
jgi:energy-coupling factor transporter ATP-binding protein EcfA2